MNVHTFRKHLAEELEGIPADAERLADDAVRVKAGPLPERDFFGR